VHNPVDMRSLNHLSSYVSQSFRSKARLGDTVGRLLLVGGFEGLRLGVAVIGIEGAEEGSDVGCTVGIGDGSIVGLVVVGPAVGRMEGLSECILVGVAVGVEVGPDVG